MLKAFHSNWTRPFFLRNKDRPYFIEDYDLLTTILSALEWKKHNGNIEMVTDKTGKEYYLMLGITHIWDSEINTSLDMLDSEHISPLPFWAAGKIFALRQQLAPCVMLDTDFIVWKSIADTIHGKTLVVTHRENINTCIYPEKSFFNMAAGYHFPAEWNWLALPCNTALLYIANNEFKEYYTSESIRFMRNLQKSVDITAEMVFAEQRLLAMCAFVKKIPIATFLNKDSLDTQDYFTHVWGLKSELQTYEFIRREFCLSCVKRIAIDFPEEISVLKKIDSLKAYIEVIC